MGNGGREGWGEGEPTRLSSMIKELGVGFDYPGLHTFGRSRSLRRQSVWVSDT